MARYQLCIIIIIIIIASDQSYWWSLTDVTRGKQQIEASMTANLACRYFGKYLLPYNSQVEK